MLCGKYDNSMSFLTVCLRDMGFFVVVFLRSCCL